MLSNQQVFEELQGQGIPVLDHGHIVLMDRMGSDECVLDAARTAYQKGTKQVSDDRTLLRYLMRHRHCYHPSMH
jgi:thymidylate synthase (FAD)